MEKKDKSKRPGKSSRQRVRHTFDLKRRAVKLYLEEGYPAELIAKELGVGYSTLGTWAKRYRERREAGLQPAAGRAGKPKVAAVAKPGRPGGSGRASAQPPFPSAPGSSHLMSDVPLGTELCSHVQPQKTKGGL